MFRPMFRGIPYVLMITSSPDLTLSFINPRLLDDVSFHPCVRFKRWEVRTGDEEALF